MYRIGIDVGGTSIKAGVVELSLGEARIVALGSTPFAARGGEGVADDAASLVHDVLRATGIAENAVESVGAVVPGSVDAARETVIDAHNLGFHDVPLRSLLQQRFPAVPVRMENDANGAALAELRYGALAGCRTAVMLTLGTGLGAAVMLDGELYRGGTGQGVELGHMLLVDGADGELCTCGNRGCAEAHCSASALARNGARAAAAMPASLLAHRMRAVSAPDAADARLIVECAQAGDPAALEAFDRYVDHLSSFCASVVNAFDPEVLAIGGGVSAAGDFLFDPLRKRTSRKCFFRTCGPLVPAAFGNEAGIIGATLLG